MTALCFIFICSRRLDASIDLLKSNLQRQQLELAAFQWLHEDMLLKTGRSSLQMVPPSRANVMQEIRKVSYQGQGFKSHFKTGRSGLQKVPASMTNEVQETRKFSYRGHSFKSHLKTGRSSIQMAPPLRFNLM